MPETLGLSPDELDLKTLPAPEVNAVEPEETLTFEDVRDMAHALFGVEDPRTLSVPILTMLFQNEVLRRETEKLQELYEARQREADKLHKLAYNDALTGLGNRRTLEKEVAAMTERKIDESTPHAILAIDLNFFKQINDTYGHATGDTVLQYVADQLRLSLVREGDLAIRKSGDEFVVVLQHVTPEEARMIADRIYHSISTVPVEIHGQQIHVSPSIGVAPFEPGQDFGKAEQIADEMLYRAKENKGTENLTVATVWDINEESNQEVIDASETLGSR